MMVVRILFVIFLFISLGSFAQSPVIPDFQFTRMDNGKPYLRKDLDKKKSTLFLFIDVECHHCQLAVTEYNANYKKLSSVAVVMVTMFKKEAVTPFLKKYGPDLSKMKNFTILSDTKYEFIGKFRPAKYPAMLLYGANQKLILYSDEDKDIPTFIKMISAQKS